MSKRELQHPSLDIVESKGTELSGKKIVLCVAGSVAAYKSIELARLLMRQDSNTDFELSWSIITGILLNGLIFLKSALN